MQENEEVESDPDVNEAKVIVKFEKEEINFMNKIKKRKVKNIKIKRPLRLQALFSSPSMWTFVFTLYYLWNFLLIIVGFILIGICTYLHIYFVKLWPKLQEYKKDDSDIEEGAVVLFCATIIPIISKDITEFIGIPYASLPIGKSHFYKAGPLLSFIDCYKAYWEDINPDQRKFDNGRIKFISTSKYEHCKQITADKQHILGINSCLTISIKSVFRKKKKRFKLFRKRKKQTLYPVVVYLTGRNYMENRPFLASDSFVRNTGALFICINYRLNILGFSDFDLMKSPHNIGYNDFLAAMDFVYKYVHLFGGNKKEITLLAEESGATTAAIYLVMKKKKKLFSKMWIMDGSCFIPNNPARSLFYDMYASKNILCNKFVTSEDIFTCLQNFSTDSLLLNSPDGWLKVDDYFYYLPNLFEERQSIIEKESNKINNPLEIVISPGSEIIDIPIVIMSKIDYIPYWINLNFSRRVGNLTKNELYTLTRLGFMNYQTTVSQTILNNDINQAYQDYIKFVENRSIYYHYVNKDIIPLGFEEVFKAIISDIRAVCPYSALAKYLQINAHIIKGPIYRIIDEANVYIEHSKIFDLPCDLHYFLQDDTTFCNSKSKSLPKEYKRSFVKSFVEFISTGKISDAYKMEYPQNSTMKEFEDTFNFLGRLGFKTKGVRSSAMLRACNIWKRGSDEYPMLVTSSKVN